MFCSYPSVYAQVFKTGVSNGAKFLPAGFQPLKQSNFCNANLFYRGGAEVRKESMQWLCTTSIWGPIKFPKKNIARR
jgi:hypothetical protein